MTSKGKSGGSKARATVKKRSINSPVTRPKSGAPFNEQDPQRRLGNFESAGEHARVGGRKSGIVGQTTKKNATDKKLKKS